MTAANNSGEPLAWHPKAPSAGVPTFASKARPAILTRGGRFSIRYPGISRSVPRLAKTPTVGGVIVQFLPALLVAWPATFWVLVGKGYTGIGSAAFNHI